MANNTISLRSLLEKEKSNGFNFLDWFRNLRTVLKQERKEYVIEEVVPNDPGANAPKADKDKFKKHMDDMLDFGCLMLATMIPELQKQHEDMVAYETGFALNDELAIDVVLQSLPDSFNQFVLNFNMNEINKTLPQVLGMLRTVEGNMKKGGSKSILMVCEVKGKGKKVAKSKGISKTKPKDKEALKPKGGVGDVKKLPCKEEIVIKGYTDARFQTDKDDSQSQSGFVFCLNGGAVSWKSSKQDTITDSTTEAEYIAASEAAKEVVWIKKFISELGVVPSISDVVGLYCDNNGAIAQAKEPRSHQRSKHILRRFHLIREIIDRGDVEICKVHTDDNIADPFTKPLAQQKHDRHTESLGIIYVSDWY
ncbi:hypothetical protein GQ457_13G016580 [Hibiscus cannabinus]